MRRTATEMPMPRPAFAPSESTGVGADDEARTVEVTMETVVLELCPDVRLVGVVIEVVVLLWTSVIAASVRRAVGTPDVGGNHGVRFGFMMLPSCRWGPQP